MSAQIRLIGLNAQVQAALAAQDPRGAGLEVLSARTSEISEETNRISEQAAAQLDTLASGLAQSVKAFEQLRTDGLAQQSLLNDKGRVEEQHLHAFRDRALELVRSIGSSLDDIQEQAHKTLDSLQFTPFHQVTLPALRTPMLGIAEAAERLLEGSGHGLAKVNLIENFKRHYTMASERKVFARIVPVAPAEKSPRSHAEPAGNPKPQAEEDPSAQTTKPASAENQDAALVAAGDAPKSHDLGSNVELF